VASLEERTEVFLLTKPVAVSGGLLVVYESADTPPVAHYRLSSSGQRLVQRLARGYRLSPSDAGELVGLDLPFVSRLQLPPSFPATDSWSMLVDSSIGGPSVWAKMLAAREQKRGLSCLMMSLHSRCVTADGIPLEVDPPRSRLAFVRLVRALTCALRPDRLLVVGREVAAKMHDLLPQQRSWVLETGFAESDIIDEDVQRGILSRALDETLFRECTFPWDSLAHALGAAQAIRAAGLNIIWSQTTARDLSERFPEAAIVWSPPNTDLSLYEPAQPRARQTHRILASMGSHPPGPRSTRFLSIDALVAVVQARETWSLTLLTANPSELRRQLRIPDSSRIKFIRRTSFEEMPSLYREHDVFYRVQNDSSVPLSCIEAMACGLAVILSESTLSTLPLLDSMVNAIAVPHGDAEALDVVLSRLETRPGGATSIGLAAAELAKRHFDMTSELNRIEWDGIPS